MRPRERELLQRLPRSGNRVVIRAHCLLDENVRYPDGAFHGGAVPEVAPLLHDGTGICQMPCPEMRAWGGVHKRFMLIGYGRKDTPIYRFPRPPFRLSVLYTRIRYWWLARHVAKEIKRYHDAG
jgi:hypothetical protein